MHSSAGNVTGGAGNVTAGVGHGTSGAKIMPKMAESIKHGSWLYVYICVYIYTYVYVYVYVYLCMFFVAHFDLKDFSSSTSFANCVCIANTQKRSWSALNGACYLADVTAS